MSFIAGLILGGLIMGINNLYKRVTGQVVSERVVLEMQSELVNATMKAFKSWMNDSLVVIDKSTNLPMKDVELKVVERGKSLGQHVVEQLSKEGYYAGETDKPL